MCLQTHRFKHIQYLYMHGTIVNCRSFLRKSCDRYEIHRFITKAIRKLPKSSSLKLVQMHTWLLWMASLRSTIPL